MRISLSLSLYIYIYNIRYATVHVSFRVLHFVYLDLHSFTPSCHTRCQATILVIK